MKLVKVDFRRWGALVFVAVAGSMLFGASLAVALPSWDLWRGALWLTLSAGTGWILLGPTLIALTKEPPLTLADHCLVAMAWGEAVLAVGAGINFTLRGSGPDPVILNSAVVALSNVVMAARLARTLGRLGVPVWKTLTAWVVVLDGGGALAFLLFYRLLLGVA